MPTLRTPWLVGTAFSALCFTVQASAADAPKKVSGLAIAPGTVVSVEYTLTDEKGAEIENNRGKEPLVYTAGDNQIIPGLEKALTGLHKGEEKDVKLSPDEAYGPVNKEAFQEVPKDKVPQEAWKVGSVLRAQGPEGQTMLVRVAEIKDKTVVMDFNHPMAGKSLAFHVKVLDVKKAEPKAAEGAPKAAPAPAPEAD